MHSEVKGVNALSFEEGESNAGGLGVVRLHEDPAHASTSPISLQETRKGRVVPSKAGRGDDGKFKFIPKVSEVRGPHHERNGLVMVLAFEGTKRLDTDFEKGAVDIVEGE
jgi:hypothetical protein